jgi:hypothetical protein
MAPSDRRALTEWVCVRDGYCWAGGCKTKVPLGIYPPSPMGRVQSASSPRSRPLIGGGATRQVKVLSLAVVEKKGFRT